MSRKYKFLDPNGTYFITFATVNWVDVFTRNEYRNILIDSFNFCSKNKGLDIHAWVIMSNHVHMIISRKGNIPLERIMRDMKKFTSVEIIHAIEESTVESRKKWMLKIFADAGKVNPNNVKFQFWQQDNHPIELDSNKEIEQKLNYIHDNPVKHGFTNAPECYDWNSAIDYAGGRGLVDIELLF
ncbi:MAG: transposase [Bacteroidetes bacterium]|nr:transposase [Bacteroidota bacterium]MBL6942917.1 transposase [Bacteroidales bacterium]